MEEVIKNKRKKVSDKQRKRRYIQKEVQNQFVRVFKKHKSK